MIASPKTYQIPQRIMRLTSITSTQKLVWALIAEMEQNDNKTFCSITNDQISAEIGIKRRQVQDCLKKLKSEGLLIEKYENGERRLKVSEPVRRSVFGLSLDNKNLDFPRLKRSYEQSIDKLSTIGVHYIAQGALYCTPPCSLSRFGVHYTAPPPCDLPHPPHALYCTPTKNRNTDIHINLNNIHKEEKENIYKRKRRKVEPKVLPVPGAKAPSTQKTKKASTKTIKNFKKFGEHGHIQLTDEHYQKLIERIGQAPLDDLIERMDLWCDKNGKSYKRYYSALLDWHRADLKKSTTLSQQRRSTIEADFKDTGSFTYA